MVICFLSRLFWFGSAWRRPDIPVSARRLCLFSCFSLSLILLTIWQARCVILCTALCFSAASFARVDQITHRSLDRLSLLSILPILNDWDEKLWPNEAQLSEHAAQRNESAQLRDLSLSLRSPEIRPFLASWWLSPSIAYWSGQPGIAGSSHESLEGIADTARFFLSDDWQEAHQICRIIKQRGLSPTISNVWRKIQRQL